MATLRVKIIGDSSQLERSFKRAGSSAAGFKRNMETAGRGALAGSGVFHGLGRAVAFASGGFLGAAGLAAAVRSSYEEMSQSATVAAQTNAVLKSTGGIANVTAGQVDRLAQSLLKKSGIDDEAVKSGENMILTFKNIRNEAGRGNDIFNQTSRAVLDMAVAMNHGNVTQENISKTAILVGKALNDPIKGLGALRRVGVSLTEQQNNQVKALVKAGKTMEAQKIILRELNSEFGGSAQKLGSTLPGKINIFRETLKNLGASLLTQLVPAMTRVINRLNAWLGNTENQKKVQQSFRTIIQDVSGALRTAAAVLRRVNQVTGGLGNTVKILIGVFIAFKALKMASAVAGIARSFGLLSGRAAASNRAITGATGSIKAARLSLIGKAGLVGAVGVASFAIASLIFKVTGLDKKFNDLGGKAFDVGSKLGLFKDQGKQFEGKIVPTQAISGFLRARAARLEAHGLSREQAAERLVATHRNLALHDAQVLAGVFGTAPREVVVHSHLHVDGKKVATSVTHHQAKDSRRKTTQTRGQQTR